MLKTIVSIKSVSLPFCLVIFLTILHLTLPYDINNHIHSLNQKNILSVKQKQKFLIIEPEKADSSLLALPDAEFRSLIIKDNNRIVDENTVQVYVIPVDSNNDTVIPSNFTTIFEQYYAIAVDFGYVLLPITNYQIVKRYDRYDLHSPFYLGVSISLFLITMFIFYSYNLVRITESQNSYYYYKRWQSSKLIFGSIVIFIVSALVTIQILYYILSFLKSPEYAKIMFSFSSFYKDAFIFSIGIISTIMLFNFISPEFRLKFLIKDLLEAKKDVNDNKEFEFNLIHHYILNDLKKMVDSRENRLDFFLIKSGLEMESHTLGLNIINKLYENIKNQEIIINILNLYKAGLLEFNKATIYLTVLGKEKAELPSLLFLNSVPPKYDYEISKAYRAFLQRNNEEAIKICSTDVLESFTKWAILKIEPNQEKLDAVVNKILGKNKKLEDAALGRLISIFKDISNKFGETKSEELSRIDNILNACLNILEVVKSIRNDYSHERDSSLFISPKVTEDTYNLINLSRAYISSVCRYLVP